MAPLSPFSAPALTRPLDQAAGSAGNATPRRRPHQPPATAPVRRLPSDLNVSARSIPRVVLAAYVNAAKLADRQHPGCGLRWQVVAAIGYIESDNARSGGSYAPGWDGVAKPPILGPVLDGTHGFGAIADTDGGRLDGNTRWDRAVGPMQFIPSTWQRYAADGNHDGIRNPEQIDDATLAAGDYLCTAGGDLMQPESLLAAVLSYNHSKPYAKAVLTVAASYLGVTLDQLGITPAELAVGHKHHHKHKHAHDQRRRTDHRTRAAHSRNPAAPTASAPTTHSPTPPPSSPAATPTGSPSTPPASTSPSQSPTASPTPSSSDSSSANASPSTS